MASMDISESAFQTPVCKIREVSNSLYLQMLVNLHSALQLQKPDSTHFHKFNTQIGIMSELRQYHPNFRVSESSSHKMTRFLLEILPKILPSCRVHSKCKKYFGKTLRCHYQGLTILQIPRKGKVLDFKRVSSNVTPDDFKELLDCSKITHAAAERMRSKR